MSQGFTDNPYASTHVADSDLTNFNTNFAALKSCFSGASAPSNQVPGQLYFNTTYKTWRGRDSTDASWYGIMHGDASQKILIYRNAAMAGWVVDSSVTDRVIAIKGGSTYTAGGAIAGTWTISGLSMAHTHASGTYAVNGNHVHKWYDNNDNNTTDQTYNSSGVLTNIAIATAKAASRPHIVADDVNTPLEDAWTSAAGNNAAVDGTSAAASTSTVSSTAAWRPAAAVMTMQYLDLT